MRTLVTGSSGFVGSHVCRALLARGHSVRAFHRAGSPMLALAGLAVEHAVGDVLDPPSLAAAMRGVDWVFHAAGRAAHWRDGAAVVETTVEGTRNALAAARAAGVRRFVFTSSVAALGVPVSGELLDEGHGFNYPPARWPYGYAKLAAEREVGAAVERGLDCVIVNPAAVFGPGDLNRVSGELVLTVGRGRVPASVQGGMNVVHVDDVASGHLAAAERGRPGQRYILGGQNLTHTEIIRAIAGAAGVRPPRLEVPPLLVAGAAAVLDVIGRVAPLPYGGDLLRLSRYFFYCDTAKATRELALRPSAPFSRAARDALAWYRANGYLAR